MEVAKINTILDRWNRDPDYLIEILQDVQDEWRHLPEETMRYLADELRVPLPRVSHIATFYGAFSLEPRGKHIMQVCLGTACHVKGAPRVMDALSRELEIEPGQTTSDQEFTLEGVRCVGACGLAPVVAVNDEHHGDIMPAKAKKLVKKYKKEDSHGAD
jgi:NADH:ubiquinone oxidoreductase subunit E